MPRRYELRGPVRRPTPWASSLGSTTRAEVVEVRAAREDWCLVVYRPANGPGEAFSAIARREDWGGVAAWPPRPGDLVEVEVRPRLRLAERPG